MAIFCCKPVTKFRIKHIEIDSWGFGKEYTSYFHYIIFIVYNYFISHNITLQIMIHNDTKKTKQTEWGGEESNNSSQLQRNQSIVNRHK